MNQPQPQPHHPEEYVGLITHTTIIKTIMVGTITIKDANLKCLNVLLITRRSISVKEGLSIKTTTSI